jgi:hypothetical protein
MLEGSDLFFKVYANLPITERRLTIAVIDNEPVSWSLAYEEISNETERGKRILDVLIRLELI